MHTEVLGEEFNQSVERNLVHAVIQVDVIRTRYDEQLLGLRRQLVDVLGVVPRVGLFTGDQQHGRGEIISMLAYIGKLKNDMGVVAVQAVVEFTPRGWNPRGVR